MEEKAINSGKIEPSGGGNELLLKGFPKSKGEKRGERAPEKR